MEAEQLVTQTVIHKKYGKGMIQKIDENYLFVVFQDSGKVCKFVYPSCFDGFLVLEDENARTEVKKIVDAWRATNDIARKEKLKHQYEETVQGIMARQQAVEEKKLKKAKLAMERSFAYNNQWKKKSE